MNIQCTDITYSADKWNFTWPAGLGKVRLVLWGDLIAETEGNSFSFMPTFYTSTTEHPPLEIILESNWAETELDICFLTLQWYSQQGSESYLIEYKAGDIWAYAASIPNNPETFLFSYQTGMLPNLQATEWRIRARDENKRLGKPLIFTWFTVTNPEPPVGVSLRCTAGTLTISKE